MRELNLDEAHASAGGNQLSKAVSGCFTGGSAGYGVAVDGNGACAALAGCIAGATVSIANGGSNAQAAAGTAAGISSNGAFAAQGGGSGPGFGCLGPAVGGVSSNGNDDKDVSASAF